MQITEGIGYFLFINFKSIAYKNCIINNKRGIYYTEKIEFAKEWLKLLKTLKNNQGSFERYHFTDFFLFW